jgi:hypothetical protein
MEGQTITRFHMLRKSLIPVTFLAIAAILSFFLTAIPSAAQTATNGASSTPSSGGANSAENPVIPRGKKLVMKDGTVQPVREYKIEGDRVRYYSLDSLDWQEMPASLVDWDATKKIEAEEAARDAKLNEKVHLQEEGRIVQPLDIDASLEVASGIFLPPGEGLFIFDGKTVTPMAEAEIGTKLSKKKALEKVLIPIPVVPTRHTVTIHGAHATLRVPLGQTEFYMRTADGREPELDLVRTKIHGDSRDIANVDELFGQEAASANTLLFQRWEIAKGVYRFTIGQSIEPGEYALIEILQEGGMSVYVWDFGVDPAPSKPTTSPK